MTLGDPNGIGPEVILKCLSDSRLRKFMDPVVVGSMPVMQAHARQLGYSDLPLRRVESLEPSDDESILVLDVANGNAPEVQFGAIRKEAGALAMEAVKKAIDLCVEGHADAMVTAPISKEAIAMAGYANRGHSEFLARRTETANYNMMMVADDFRVGLVTEHIPIWEVPRQVTTEAILEKLHIIVRSLQEDFAIPRPRIAVLGLNPHAGDGGVLGEEENEIITPAIKAACEAGYLAFGPFPADGFFAVGDYKNYDAVLAMYHDQGLIPFKAIAFHNGVNFSAGLPIVRTSPDHGTAFDIAGKGEASPESMRSALFLACDVARRRREATQTAHS